MHVQAATAQYMTDLEDFLKATAVPSKLAMRTTTFMRYVLLRRPLHASSELLSGASSHDLPICLKFICVPPLSCCHNQ
jgi:hypothetical protein